VPLNESFAVLALLVFSTSLAQMMLGGTEDSGSILYRVLLLSIYGTAGALALSSGAVVGIITLCPMVAAIFALPALSVMWSVNPMETVERTVGFYGTILFGLYLGWQYSLEKVIKLVGSAFLIGTFLSAATVVLLPSIGIDQSGVLGGSLLGVHLHKSKLGGACAAGALVMLYAILCSSGNVRRLFVLGFVVNLVLLIGAQSATNLVATVIGLSLALFILLFQYHAKFGVLLMMVGALFAPLLLAIVLHFDLFTLFLEALGKDASLTNRVPLWHLLWPFIEDRFWLGYGYAAFWQSGLPWVNLVEARMNFLPHYSHNGVIELWLAGGLIFVIAYLSVYVFTLIKSAIFAWQGRGSPASGYPFVFLIMVAAVNITEARAMSRNDFLLVLFGVMIALCGRSVSLRVGRAQRERAAATARPVGFRSTLSGDAVTSRQVRG